MRGARRRLTIIFVAVFFVDTILFLKGFRVVTDAIERFLGSGFPDLHLCQS